MTIIYFCLSIILTLGSVVVILSNKNMNYIALTGLLFGVVSITYFNIQWEEKKPIKFRQLTPEEIRLLDKDNA